MTIFTNFLIIYVDDVILYSNSQQEALAHCELLFQRASTYGIQFKPSKCILLSTSLDILGHHISSEGRKRTNSGITAITEMPRPTTPTEVKRFTLGPVGYFREYIQNMHSRTSYLWSLLTKGTKFYWTPEHEQEFNDLKNTIVSPDILLYHPNCDLLFEIHTDASKKGVGSMLAQRHDGQLRPVRFASKAFSPAQSRWAPMDQELYAVKFALDTFRPYIMGKHVKIFTDHSNLQFLKSVSPKQAVKT